MPDETPPPNPTPLKAEIVDDIPVRQPGATTTEVAGQPVAAPQDAKTDEEPAKEAKPQPAAKSLKPKAKPANARPMAAIVVAGLVGMALVVAAIFAFRQN